MSEEGCKSCAEVILKEYFKERDKDGDGVIVDLEVLIKLLDEGKSLEEALKECAEYLPGSWLCKYFTMKMIVEELDKGRKLKEILEEMAKKEPLRYRGCVKGEGIIYEIEEVKQE
jgi:pilus assembly protein TadC